MFKIIKDPNGNSHKINIHKNMLWTWPYILKARQLGIPVWRIRAIKSYLVPLDKMEQQAASMHKNLGKGNNKFIIMLPLKKQVCESIGEGLIRIVGHEDCLSAHYFEDTLHSLAHELAHSVEFEHTPKRFIIECKLMASFSKLAQKLGYLGY